MKSLVIIPTYNEKQNIEAIIQAILAQEIPGIEILIVDDGSPDGTGALVAAMMEREPRLHLLSRERKMGLGTAYVAGFRFALAHDFDRVIEMDADFSHDPRDLKRLLEASDEADIVIGSRYITGVNVVNWPLRRLLLSMFASYYTRIITGLPLRDCTAGFKCFRREVLEHIDLDRVRSDGYSFQIEMNFRAWVHGFRIQEIPIVFVDRAAGASKMSKKIIYEAVGMVWKLKWLKICHRL
ncbi:MAG TPA: polyprenol monophosphomannose synthase [bacterium]|nr:polyprenol monophosphomannose synthase [bacterium]HQI48159.1 polyprenol monophosphomannose synthase [bacterium]HQJ65702.1 polyprenol monophosphomannose synthase [bacterium]